MPALTFEEIRADTPASSTLIHFNNAGSSLSPQPVLEAVINHLRLEQEIGGYEASDLAAEKIDNFYHALAELLCCEASEIAYVENATRAWDMVFYAIPFNKGDRVITGQSEYASNYLALMQLAKHKEILNQLNPPFIDLYSAKWLDKGSYQFRSDAKRFENWERYVAGQIGLAVAVQYAIELGLPYIEDRVQTLAKTLRAKLERIEGVNVFERGNPLSGIVTFTKDQQDPHQLKLRLRKNGVNTSVTTRDNAQLDFAARNLGDLNRVSLHYYNTTDEIDRLLELLG